MAPKLRRRRNYLINKKLQLRYAGFIFLTLFVITATAALGLSLGVWNLLMDEFSRPSIQSRLETASRIYEYENARLGTTARAAKRLAEFGEVDLLSIREKEIFKDILTANNYALARKVLLLIILVALGTIFLTHKIAGPLFRFQKTFRDVTGGNLAQRVYLRKHDHVKEILPDLNTMIGQLDYTITKTKVLVSLLEQETRAQGGPSELAARYFTELANELNHYKTTNAYSAS